MKFGIGFANILHWATAAGAVEFGQAAEAAGFDSVWTVEHVVYPDSYASVYPYDPAGRMLTAAEWGEGRDGWLPTEADREYVRNLMVPAAGPGEMASWIAAPDHGIHGKPVDFEYVRRA